MDKGGKYITRNADNDGKIEIRPIENGFIISYYGFMAKRYEEFVPGLTELKAWLDEFYKLS